MTRTLPRIGLGPAIAGLGLLLLGACGSLLPPAVAPPAFYALVAPNRGTPPRAAPRTGPTLIVSPPQAAAGLDSTRLLYTRQPHRLDYFAHSEWVDTPARMLAPLIVAALDRAGPFGAVLRAPAPAAGEIRLDTEILRLQQDFAAVPSQARFTLRAVISDTRSRQVLATREFDRSVVAARDDAEGGVVAANAAVQAVLQDLAGFCAETLAVRGGSAAQAAPYR